MRIVSLSPAGTEWLAAAGRMASLVARSDRCDHPPEALERHVIMLASEGGASEGSAIDPRRLDLDHIAGLQADLLLADASESEAAVLRRSLEEVLEPGMVPEIFSIQPRTFKQILDAALRLARRIDAASDLMRWMATQEMRLRSLGERLASRPAPGRPRVACIQGFDPLLIAGKWIPEVVAHAAGRAILAEAGEPTRKVSLPQIGEADPDVIALMPVEMSSTAARGKLHLLTLQEGWESLRAVREGNVFLFDGRLFSRPGPRIYRAVELMAAAMHPHASPDEPYTDEMQPLRGAL